MGKIADKMYCAFVLTLYVVFVLDVFLLTFNPFGLSQRVEWGMKPPYHWVVGNVEAHTDGSFDDSLYSSNGKECANIYRYGKTGPVKVFGLGFSKQVETRSQALAIAEAECR